MKETFIRRLDAKDLDSITSVHMAAFPTTALSKLGVGTVKRYYDWQLTGPHDVFPLGTFHGNQLCGFCFGGVFHGATGGFIYRYRLYLFFRVLSRPWLITNPIFRNRLNLGLYILTHKKKKYVTFTDTETKPRTADFSILAVAVQPSWQNTGVGRKLMDSSEKIARRKSFDRMSLVVHPSNSKAISFYQSLGWVKLLKDECWQGEMYKELI